MSFVKTKSGVKTEIIRSKNMVYYPGTIKSDFDIQSVDKYWENEEGIIVFWDYWKFMNVGDDPEPKPQLFRKYIFNDLLSYKKEGEFLADFILKNFTHKPARCLYAGFMYTFHFLSWLLPAFLVFGVFGIANLLNRFLKTYSPFKLEIKPKDEVF